MSEQRGKPRKEGGGGQITTNRPHTAKPRCVSSNITHRRPAGGGHRGRLTSPVAQRPCTRLGQKGTKGLMLSFGLFRAATAETSKNSHNSLLPFPPPPAFKVRSPPTARARPRCWVWGGARPRIRPPRPRGKGPRAPGRRQMRCPALTRVWGAKPALPAPRALAQWWRATWCTIDRGCGGRGGAGGCGGDRRRATDGLQPPPASTPPDHGRPPPRSPRPAPRVGPGLVWGAFLRQGGKGWEPRCRPPVRHAGLLPRSSPIGRALASLDRRRRPRMASLHSLKRMRGPVGAAWGVKMQEGAARAGQEGGVAVCCPPRRRDR